MKLAEIYEGWRNKVIPPKKLKEEIARVRAERLIICHHCAYNSRFHKTKRPDIHCTICGCTLSAKTSCLSCSCPCPLLSGMLYCQEKKKKQLIRRKMENNEDYTVELKKINLAELISLLQELYGKGARFIDIIATPNEKQDRFGIFVREDYIDKENNKFTDEELSAPIDDDDDTSESNDIDFNDLV